MSPSREFHIAPGIVAGDCIKQALDVPAGSLLEHQDVLSCGPLPQLRSLEDWRSVRDGYWRALDPEHQFPFPDTDRELLANAHALHRAESVTIWIGTGLADQLFLVWIPQLFRVLGVNPEKLDVIQFLSDPITGEEITAVGLLDSDKLKAHPPATYLDIAGLSILDEAWAAVTAPDPSSLVTLLAVNLEHPSIMQRSLRWLMYRFPDVETGLGIWEMELLRQVVEKGPTAIKVIGFTMIRSIDWLDLVGTPYLFGLLRKLADPELRQPLLSLTGNIANMMETDLHITPVGKSVLAGEANFVELNGIDDWVGGIHLDSSHGQVWFQRNGLLIPAH